MKGATTMNMRMWIAMCAVLGLWLGGAGAVCAQDEEPAPPPAEESPAPAPADDASAAPEGGGEGGGTDFKQLTKDEAPKTLEELEKDGAEDPVDEGASEGGPTPVAKAPADAKPAVDPKEQKNLEMEGLIHWLQTGTGVGFNGKPYDYTNHLKNLDDWKSAFDLGAAPGNELAGMSEDGQKVALAKAYGKTLLGGANAARKGGVPGLLTHTAKQAGKALAGTAIDGMTVTAMQNISNYNLAFHEHVRQTVENGAGRAPSVVGNSHLMTFFDQRRGLIEQVSGEPAPRPDASGRYDHAAVQGYLDRHSLALYTHVGMLRETTNGHGFPLGGGTLVGSGRWGAAPQYSPDYYKRVVLPKLREEQGRNGGWTPPAPSR
jgi:hypothetical protein